MKKNNKTSFFKKIVKTIPVFFGVAVFAYMIFLVRTIEVPTMLPIDEINIVGELKHLDKGKIEQVVAGNISGGYFTVDLNDVRDILLQQPWLKSVSLRRQWPASVNIFIEEQTPIAYWNDDSYLSDNGEIFKPESIDKKLNLPVLRGPNGQHENVWQFMNVLYKEMALLDYEVVRLALDNRRAWQLEISSLYGEEAARISIKLGRFDTEKRMQRFIDLLPALTADSGLMSNKIKVIDMRYPNGFAVQMTDENNLKINSVSHDSAHRRYAVVKQVGRA